MSPYVWFRFRSLLTGLADIRNRSLRSRRRIFHRRYRQDLRRGSRRSDLHRTDLLSYYPGNRYEPAVYLLRNHYSGCSNAGLSEVRSEEIMNTFMKGAVFTAPFFWDFTQILRSFCIVLLYFCPNFSYYLHWGILYGQTRKIFRPALFL